MYFRIAHAACDGSESGCTEAQVGIEVTDFIAGAQLREAVESVLPSGTGERVVGGIELSDADEPRQILIELQIIDRLPYHRLQEFFQIACRVWACPFNGDKLRDGHFVALAGCSGSDIFAP